MAVKSKYKIILAPLTIAASDPDFKPIKRFLNLSGQYKRQALDTLQPVNIFFESTGIDVLEWLEVAVDSWLTNDGKYVEPEIVQEFMANTTSISNLIRQLQELERQYPPIYPRRRISRFLKRG